MILFQDLCLHLSFVVLSEFVELVGELDNSLIQFTVLRREAVSVRKFRILITWRQILLDVFQILICILCYADRRVLLDAGQ